MTNFAIALSQCCTTKNGLWREATMNEFTCICLEVVFVMSLLHVLAKALFDIDLIDLIEKMFDRKNGEKKNEDE